MIRGLCFVAGLAALGAMAHRTIVQGSGYGSPDAYVTLAATGLVICLAVAVGHVWSNGRVFVALGMTLALIAGDTYQFARTVDQEMQHRATLQAPLVAAHRRREMAVERVFTAEQGMATAKTVSTRMQAALAAQAAALAASRVDAAKRGCASNCRKLHEAALLTAARDVTEARHDQDAARQRVTGELASARAALAALPNATPTSSAADLLGWSTDVFNAVLAGLKASAINIGAIFALAFAGHGGRHPARVHAGEGPHDQVARFALERYLPDAAGEITLAEAWAAYGHWCRACGVSSMPAQVFERELALLAEQAALGLDRDDKRGLVIRGMAPALLEAA